MGLQPTVAEGEQSASGKGMASPETLSGRLTNYDIKKIQAPLIAIVVIALVAHISYFVHFHDIYAPDSSSYITPAVNLLHGQGFTGPDGRPETARTPGYPLLIALFLAAGGGPKSLVFFQHLMLVGLITATVIVAFRLFGSRRQAFMVGVLLLIDLPILEAANSVLTEALFTLVLAAALAFLLTASRQPDSPSSTPLLFSGLLAGASVLIRPVTLYLFVPAAAYLILAKSRFRLRSVFAFVIPFTFLPVLWAARNYYETGYFTVSTISGRELLCWRAGGVLALDDPGNFNNNISKRCTQLENRVCDELTRIHRKDCSQFGTEEKSACALRLGRRILVEHPIGSLRLAIRGMAVMFLDGGPSSLQGITRTNAHVGIRLLMIYTIPAFCFALAGLLRLWSQDRRLFYFFFLIIGYFVVVSAGGDTSSRHRVPIMPMYAMLIAAGFEGVLNLGRSHYPQRS